MLKQLKRAAVAATLSVLMVSLAYAQGGTGGLDSIAAVGQNVFDSIDSASVIFVALAILIAGLGMAFRWIGLQVAGWIVGGTILAGSAFEIATALMT